VPAALHDRWPGPVPHRLRALPSRRFGLLRVRSLRRRRQRRPRAAPTVPEGALSRTGAHFDSRAMVGTPASPRSKKP
jgi:hypothetical protein